MVVAGAADGEADAEAEADAGAEPDPDGEALPLEEGAAGEDVAAKADELMISLQSSSHENVIKNMHVLAEGWQLDPANVAGTPR